MTIVNILNNTLIYSRHGEKKTEQQNVSLRAVLITITFLSAIFSVYASIFAGLVFFGYYQPSIFIFLCFSYRFLY